MPHPSRAQEPPPAGPFAGPAPHTGPPGHPFSLLPPDLDTMRADAADILDGDTPPLTAQEHALTVTRLRACLLVLVPRVARTARALPEGGRRTAALVAVAEACRALGAGSHGTDRDAALSSPHRLAYTVELLCAQYQRLSAAFWTPPRTEGPALVAAGEHWDAVRVVCPLAPRVLGRLGADSGAVVEDRASALLYWLVEPGRADAWRLPGAAVRVLGAGTYVAVPPAHHTAARRLRWRVPCVPPNCLTRPARLHEALVTELAGPPGRPHTEGQERGRDPAR